MAQDITSKVCEGFESTANNPYTEHSVSWDAYQIGRWLKIAGYNKPTFASTFRGKIYKIGLNERSEIKVKLLDNGEVTYYEPKCSQGNTKVIKMLKSAWG